MADRRGRSPSGGSLRGCHFREDRFGGCHFREDRFGGCRFREDRFGGCRFRGRSLPPRAGGADGASGAR
ncbi:pentapeptide repeat-containing protein [Halorubrum ezzemoulense]|uniref:pentapeptide repeat-containing protein n=1 Tax=Halorubrum ezzemoulense TaxID=337243 RepID=UPI0037426045